MKMFVLLLVINFVVNTILCSKLCFYIYIIHVVRCLLGGFVEGSVEKDTMHGLNWTKSLDTFFIEADESARNNTEQEDLLWQYFGSDHGFVRHYPGSSWHQLKEDVSPLDELFILLFV